jgi:hypothetical protein
VAYLDISPMLVAMREQPATFSMSKGWLKHRPSRHRFWVGVDGHVTVDAECGCAGLSVRAEQGRELHQALQVWRTEYWVPHEVNRHFARHFQPAAFWRRWISAFLAMWSRDREDSAFALYGRTWAESGRSLSEPNEPPPEGPTRLDQPPPLAPSSPHVHREPEEVAA